MPQRAIYVSVDLDRRIRAHDLAVSAVCQRALERQCRIAERKAAAIADARTAIVGSRRAWRNRDKATP